MTRQPYDREREYDEDIDSRDAGWRRNADKIALGIGLVFLFYGLYSLQDNFMMGDEQFHYDQIERFLRWEWTVNPSLTTIPGYHLLMAIPAWTGYFSSLQAFRILSFVIGSLSIIVFHLIARRVDADSAVIRTVQYVVFPLLFPLFSLVYTDVVALLFLFLSLLLFIRRQFYLSGIVAFANVLIRQNNVVWIAFFIAVSAWETFLYVRSHLHEPVMPYVFALVRQNAVYLLGIALFFLFVWWNQGVVLGDEFAHPFPAIHFGNIHFALFLFFFLFLPLIAASLPDIRKQVARYWLPIFAGIGVYFLLYWLTFDNTHPYNQPDLDWFLHNRILAFFTATDLRKAIFFVPMAASVLYFTVARVRRPFAALFFPFAALSLMPYWLIEQRYALPLFALFLLLRTPTQKHVEYIMAAYWLFLSVILFQGISRGAYFL